MYKYNYLYSIINSFILFIIFLLAGCYYLNKHKEYSILFFLFAFLFFILLIVYCKNRHIKNTYEEIV
jgi:hypothetical protein